MYQIIVLLDGSKGVSMSGESMRLVRGQRFVFHVARHSDIGGKGGKGGT